MACLQIYRELPNLRTFLQVHSNPKEVSYLSWQNTYPNFKITCHIKVKIFLVNLTPKELTPCKIPHICRCTFKSEESYLPMVPYKKSITNINPDDNLNIKNIFMWKYN